MQALHGLTLSQRQVLILLYDAPGQRMRMTELADAALLTRSACTRLVGSRRSGTSPGVQPPMIGAGSMSNPRIPARAGTPARATYREGVRAALLDRLRTTDQVALGDIWARVRAEAFPSSDPTGRTVAHTARKP